MLIRLLSLLLIACGTATAQVAERSFDVSLLTGLEAPAEFSVGLPLALLYGQDDLDGEGGEPVSRSRGLDAGPLIEILRSTLGGESSEDVAGFEARGGVLRVRHRQSELERIPAILDHVSASALRWSDVAVYAIDPQRAYGSSTAVLAPEATKELLSAAGTRLVGTLRLSHGAVRRIGRERTDRFVGDADVEVASDSTISDPRVLALRTGLRLTVGAWATTGGRRIVRVAGGQSRLQEMRLRRPAGEQIGRLQLPVVDSTRVQGSAVLGAGEGFILAAQGAQAADAWLIRLSAAQDPSDQAGMPVLLPLGIASAELGGRCRVGSNGGIRNLLVGNAEELDSFVEADVTLNALRQSVPSFWEGQGASLWALGRSIFVHADADRVRAMHEALNQHLGALTQPLAVELRAGVIDAEVAAGLVGNGDLAPELVESLGIRAAATVLAGDAFHLVAGREIAHIGELEVEIAQKAAIARPTPGSSFAGALFNGRLSRSSAQGIGLELDAALNESSIAKPFDTPIGEIDQIEVETSAVSFADSLPLGRWRVLGMSPAPEGKEGVLVFAARVRD